MLPRYERQEIRTILPCCRSIMGGSTARQTRKVERKLRSMTSPVLVGHLVNEGILGSAGRPAWGAFGRVYKSF
jgi:hypothetical protein